MSIPLEALKRGLLLFWAGWFTVVLVTNVCDGAKALGLLAPNWVFASGNFALIGSATAKFGTPAAVNGLLFAGVVVWQATATVLFWQGVAVAPGSGRPSWGRANTAFAVSLGLWAAFLIADELFLAYEMAGVHLRLFTAELATLLAIHLLPDHHSTET